MQYLPVFDSLIRFPALFLSLLILLFMFNLHSCDHKCSVFNPLLHLKSSSCQWAKSGALTACTVVGNISLSKLSYEHSIYSYCIAMRTISVMLVLHASLSSTNHIPPATFNFDRQLKPAGPRDTCIRCPLDCITRKKCTSLFAVKYFKIISG